MENADEEFLRLKAEAQEANKRLKMTKEALKILEEEISVLQGTFYSPIEVVWRPKNMESSQITVDHFNALFRDKCPNGDGYKITLSAAYNEGYGVAIDDKISSNASFDSKLSDSSTTQCPPDLFGNTYPPEFAHLIPASSTNASMYDDVASWILGLRQWESGRLAVNDDENPAMGIWIAKQRAIQGALETGKIVSQTGIRHSRSNKILLSDQYFYFDISPCVVIVPIMNLEVAKAWDGDQSIAYEAVVMAGTWEWNTFPVICKRIGMTNKGLLASIDEINLAGDLLTRVLCGLAYSLLNTERPYLNELAKHRLKNFREDFCNVVSGLTVPAPIEDMEANFLVRKVTLGGEGHDPAPDPILLTVKSAVNWSWRHNQQLLAAGEPKEDDDFDEEEEEELELFERPVTWDDLAASLGQH